MKLLLDENLPHRLRPLLVGHDVFTVAFMKWNGIENGNLLALAASNGFDAVVTKDNRIRAKCDASALFHSDLEGEIEFDCGHSPAGSGTLGRIAKPAAAKCGANPAGNGGP